MNYKVLSLLQPWASLVVTGRKKIETRSWDTKHRGPLLIHASAKPFKPIKGMEHLLAHMNESGFFEEVPYMPYGAIIGMVNVESTFSLNITLIGQRIKIASDGEYDYVEVTNQEHAFGEYSDGRTGWLLNDPWMVDEPMPAKGHLGIWNWEGEIILKKQQVFRGLLPMLHDIPEELIADEIAAFRKLHPTDKHSDNILRPYAINQIIRRKKTSQS